MCKTARSSVILILSPRNIASMRSCKGFSFASWMSLQRFIRDAIFRVVKKQTDSFRRAICFPGARDHRQRAAADAGRELSESVLPGFSMPVP